MRREPNVPEAYDDTIHTIGASNKSVTDIAKVLTGVKWTLIYRKYYIESGVSVPHHQHNNYSECVGGVRFNLLSSNYIITHHQLH